MWVTNFLFGLAFVALFTFPKIYENNKTDIDAQLSMLRSKIQEVEDKWVLFNNQFKKIYIFEFLFFCRIKSIIPLGKKTPVAATESEKDK